MKTKKNLNRKRTGLGSLLMALAGVIASCDILPIGVAMYGCPNADYDIKGKVVDENGKGIENIKIEIGHVQTSTPGVIYDYEYIPFYTDLKTDADGNYHYIGNDFPNNQLRIKAEDIDGEEHGGQFAPDSVELKVEFKDGKSKAWYSGKAEAAAPDIKLKKVSE